MNPVLGFIREHPFACTSAGSCVTGFITWSMPFLQWTALAVAVVSGVISIVRNTRGKRDREDD